MMRVNGEMSLRNYMIMRNVLYTGWIKGAKSASFLYISGLLERLRQAFESYVKGSLDKARFFCLFVLLLLAVTFQKV